MFTRIAVRATHACPGRTELMSSVLRGAAIGDGNEIRSYLPSMLPVTSDGSVTLAMLPLSYTLPTD